MFFKKNSEKKKIYNEDCSKLRELYYLYKNAKYDLERMVFLIEDKIFLIEANTSDEFTEKYNDFILKVKESEPKNISIQPNYIRIKNKSEIQFANEKYTMIINYEEFMLKKEYSNEEYLKRKEKFEILYKEYREYLNVFCKKHNTTVNEIFKWL